MRQTTIRQYAIGKPNLKLIFDLAGKELDPSLIFDFGKFIIARSGVNRNHSDITGEAQKAAVNDWVGKAILYHDHEANVSNQIGRIYEAWTEEIDGETVTYGRGYGIRTDDLKDTFDRIDGGIHKEMSCGYDPTKSVCSKCNSDLTGDGRMDCPQGHVMGQDDAYARDLAFEPEHISFVARPAVDGAGLQFNETQLRQMERDAEDGQAVREWAVDQFKQYMRLNQPGLSDDVFNSLAQKLSAKEMMTLANVEKERYHNSMPSGKQVMETPPTQAEELPPIKLEEGVKNIMEGLK